MQSRKGLKTRSEKAMRIGIDREFQDLIRTMGFCLCTLYTGTYIDMLSSANFIDMLSLSTKNFFVDDTTYFFLTEQWHMVKWLWKTSYK